MRLFLTCVVLLSNYCVSADLHVRSVCDVAAEQTQFATSFHDIYFTPLTVPQGEKVAASLAAFITNDTETFPQFFHHFYKNILQQLDVSDRILLLGKMAKIVLTIGFTDANEMALIAEDVFNKAVQLHFDEARQAAHANPTHPECEAIRTLGRFFESKANAAQLLAELKTRIGVSCESCYAEVREIMRDTCPFFNF